MEISTSYQAEFKCPEFSPSAIMDLRCRLGQSRADFARSFGVSLEIIYSWENGQSIPSVLERSCMVRLSQQAEQYSDKTALRPTLECALRDQKVSQIHSDQVTLAN